MAVYLRWVDDGGVGGDEDADDGEVLSAVRAAVLPVAGREVFGERSREYDDPSIATMMPRCSRRSSKLAASIGSASRSPQLAMPPWRVTMVEDSR